jgi:hypothetical protein
LNEEENVITIHQVEAVRSAKIQETDGSKADRLGLSGLELYCIQYLTRGMGGRGAVQFVNELTARFSTGKECGDFVRARYPNRIRIGGHGIMRLEIRG